MTSAETSCDTTTQLAWINENKDLLIEILKEGVNSSTSTELIIKGLLAIVPIIISAVVAYVIWAQHNTSKRKLSFELYNRRFSVFDEALKYYLAFYSKEPSALDNASPGFTRAYREALFLFGQDSSVYRALTALKDAVANNLAHKNSYIDPTPIMIEVENTFQPWLDYRKFNT